jgi:hypothetical protein
MKASRQLFFYATLATTIAMTPAASSGQAQGGAPAAPPKYAPNVPAKITTADTVETRIGALRF